MEINFRSAFNPNTLSGDNNSILMQENNKFEELPHSETCSGIPNENNDFPTIQTNRRPSITPEVLFWEVLSKSKLDKNIRIVDIQLIFDYVKSNLSNFQIKTPFAILRSSVTGLKRSLLMTQDKRIFVLFKKNQIKENVSYEIKGSSFQPLKPKNFFYRSKVLSDMKGEGRYKKFYIALECLSTSTYHPTTIGIVSLAAKKGSAERVSAEREIEILKIVTRCGRSSEILW